MDTVTEACRICMRGKKHHPQSNSKGDVEYYYNYFNNLEKCLKFKSNKGCILCDSYLDEEERGKGISIYNKNICRSCLIDIKIKINSEIKDWRDF